MSYSDALAEKRKNGILVAAHRGSAAGNVPCNTPAAFNAALMQNADIIEFDVSISRDGQLFVFHPGMEPAHLGTKLYIKARSAASVSALRYRNFDNVKTSYGIKPLDEVLRQLKGRCFMNIDKFWTAPEQITAAVRRCGVEEQVIIKTSPKEKYFADVEKYAPDLMYMPIISKNDTVCDDLLKRKINLIGAEVLFEKDDDPVCTKEFPDAMHEKGLFVWGNAIIYNEKAVISAHHTDDRAVSGDLTGGWGFFRERGFDIVQTDWAGLAKDYFSK